MSSTAFSKDENCGFDFSNSKDTKSVQYADELNFLTELAAQISACSMSAISLFTDKNRLFLSHYGFEIQNSAYEDSFCADAILENGDTFLIQNTQEDPRFKSNPLVIGKPHIKSCFGIVIKDNMGLPIGTLCVMDQTPQILNDNQILSLKKIAQQVRVVFEVYKLHLSELEKLALDEMNLILLQDGQELNRIGAWSLNLENHKVFWTKMVYRIYEVDDDFQPNFENAIDFIHPEDKAFLIESVHHCISTGKDFSVQTRLITAKGRTIWVRCSGKKKGNQMVGSFQDITSIKEDEIKFKTIINASSSILVILDKEGRITELNETATNLVNMDRSKFIGKFFWDANYWNIDASYIDDLKLKFRKAIQGIEKSEEMVIWLNGEIPFTVQFIVRPIFNQHQDILFVLVEAIPIQDIVDERNNNRFIMEGANLATGIWDYQTNEIHFDDQWYAMLGYTQAELYPMTRDKWLSLFHPEDSAKSREMLHRVFNKEIDLYQLEVRIKHKNGNWIWVEDKGKVLHWSNEGKPHSMYGIHQDIT